VINKLDDKETKKPTEETVGLNEGKIEIINENLLLEDKKWTKINIFFKCKKCYSVFVRHGQRRRNVLSTLNNLKF